MAKRQDTGSNAAHQNQRLTPQNEDAVPELDEDGKGRAADEDDELEDTEDLDEEEGDEDIERE